MLFDQMFGNIATQSGGTPSFITGNEPAYSAKPPQQVAGPINPANQQMQAPTPMPPNVSIGYGPVQPDDGGGQTAEDLDFHDNASPDDWNNNETGLDPTLNDHASPDDWGNPTQPPGQIDPGMNAGMPGGNLFHDLFKGGGQIDPGFINQPIFGMPPQQSQQPQMPAWAQGRNISQGPDGLYKDDQGYLLDQSGKTVGTMAHHNDWLRQQQRFADRDKQFRPPFQGTIGLF